MITFRSQKLHPKLGFEDYVRLPGVSHSFVKYQENGVLPYREPTEKMRLGSLVDAFLTEPDKVDATNPLFKQARTIASRIQNRHGDMLSSMEPQRSYSGVMRSGDMELDVCGRLDWELPGKIVLDLKVTAAETPKQFAALVDYMGYKNQLFNYAGLSGANVAFIIPYSIPLGDCLPIVSVPVGGSNPFWERAILMHGRAVR